ncbi:MAG: FlgD immunoglobulin-like domain containing protein [Melioribacteraceae bacterium]|nr:FlgD immunoglobulin-like domain containing protein [Melioribacteraceae bacterium]
MNTSNTTLIVYDILGREIKTLINQQLPSGEHSVTWNGTNNNGQGVSAGVYFYRLIIGDPSTSSGQGFVQTKKMVLTDGVSAHSSASINKSTNHKKIIQLNNHLRRAII